jgi:hypothetical protein
MDIGVIITLTNNSKYYNIGPNAEEKLLPADYKIIEINNYLFPIDVLPPDWDWTNISKEILNKCLPIIFKELLSPGVIKKSNDFWPDLILLNWPDINKIIYHNLYCSPINNLDDLYINLSICIKNNLQVLFEIDNILIFSNQEIFNHLIGKNQDIEPNKFLDFVLQFIAGLKRDNPTIENTFMTDIYKSAFDDIHNRNWDNYYHKSDIHKYQDDNIHDVIEAGVLNFNINNKNILNILNECIDGKNAIISGGAVIKSIIAFDYKYHDVDIFVNSIGLVNCLEVLYQNFKDIIIFNVFNTCVNVLINGLTLQFVITDNPINWITGTSKRQGFDFEHLKFIIANNKIYCTFGAYYCLKTWQTYQSKDIKGCSFPHRLRKAISTLPILKNNILDEFSSHLLDKYIIERDVKYVNIFDNYDVNNVSYLIKKVYKVDTIYHISNKYVYKHAEKYQIISYEFDNMLTDLMKNIGYTRKNKTEVTELNISDKEKKDMAESSNLTKSKKDVAESSNLIKSKKDKADESDKNEVFEYGPKLMSVKYTQYFINNSGLIPPVIICKKIKNDYLVIKPYKPGLIINRVFRNLDYMLIEVNDVKGLYVGNVIYCNISNIYSKKIINVDIDDKIHPMPLIKALWFIRYSDLE